MEVLPPSGDFEQLHADNISIPYISDDRIMTRGKNLTQENLRLYF